MTAVLGSKHPRIVELRRLFGRRNSRSEEVVLEGARTVGEALDAGLAPACVILAEPHASDPAVASVTTRLTSDVEVLVVREHTFAQLAPSVSPQPMLAVIARPAGRVPDPAPPDGVVLVLADVSDPGNVGTLIRAGDAFGVSAVVVVGGADPWGPKAVRSSAGSVLRVSIAAYDNADDALSGLSRAGYRIVATSVDHGRPHDDGVLAGPVAIVMGSEAHGLRPELACLVDEWANIVMPGRTESLNVAMAGTLLLHEAHARRS